jgi:hypothetical protein
MQGQDGKCLACHSDAGHMMQAVKPPAGASESSCAAAPTRPPFLSAFVNPQFVATDHGKIGCTGCHGGDATRDDQDAAHQGLRNADDTCKACHEDIAKKHATSLHNTLNGMVHALKLRSGEENFHKLNPMWEADCQTCHASCSDCHLTLPKAVGGGLIKGHELFKRPPMKDTCAVCHGSRAGGEYLGNFHGVKPDVHFEAGMHCLDCHKNDMHGDGQTYTSRWKVAGKPECTDCHDALPNDRAKAHSDRHVKVSCQACHGQPYQNCFSCHASEENGVYRRQAGKKVLDLKIGHNTEPGYPYAIVPLRNNPVSRDSFTYLGDNLLPDFDKYPTWKTASPHNIRRLPAHSGRCRDCHENPDIFLTKDKLQLGGARANTNSALTDIEGDGR